MAGRTKKRNILGNGCKLSILALALPFFIACNDVNNRVPDHIPARAEKDFALDPDAKAIPGIVYILQLEHKNFPDDSLKFDTDEKGTDMIPLDLVHTSTYNFRIHPNSRFYLELYKGNALVFSIGFENPEKSVQLEQGLYKLKFIAREDLVSDTMMIIPVMMQPDMKKVGPTVNSFTVKKFMMYFSEYDCLGCDLSEASFEDMSLKKIDFYASNFKNTKLTRSILDSSTFYYAHMHNTQIDTASLKHSWFNSIGNMSFANFTASNLVGTTFTGSYGRFVSFRESRLEECDLTSAGLINSDLYNSIFVNCKMNNSEVTGCNMKWIDFKGCDISGAQFCSSNFENSRASMMIVNDQTKCWPDSLKK